MLKEKDNKKIWVTNGMIILCLILFVAFPTSNIFQKMVAYATFLVVIPMLYVKIVLKENLKSYGVQKGDWKRGIIFGGASLLLSLAIFYFLLHYTNFLSQYSLSLIVTGKFLYFALYEIFLVGFFVLIYELFFRGFVMFSFAPSAKYWSVAVQFLLFVTFLFFIGGLQWSLIYYIIVAPLAGITAYYSRSLIYSLLADWIFIVIADSLVIKMLK